MLKMLFLKCFIFTCIVYKFLCSNCNVTYYDKAQHHFNMRSGEHFAISHLIGKRVESTRCAVSDQLSWQNHDSNFNDFTILCWGNNVFRLLLKESFLIARNSTVLHKNTAFVPLLLFD